MSDFKRKNLLEIKKMCLAEVEKYYSELRKYDYENSVPMKNIKIRKIIHNLLLEIIKIDRLLSKEELCILSDKRVKTKSSKIYACTHIGGNDVQRTFEAINEHAYLFLGDPREIYRDFTGLLLNLNGSICFDTSDKYDRHIAYERAIELLSKNANLLIYPEGAWNITDNLPVMELYEGTVKMAIETNSEIIPIAIEQYYNRFYVSIGKNIVCRGLELSDVSYINGYLRDCLASLKWEIWEKNGICQRSDISQEFVENFMQNIVDKCEYGFTIQDVYDTMYKDAEKISPDDAYIVSPKRQYELKMKYSN